MNSSLNLFKTSFDYRHEFDDDDLDILSERWPEINFENIPTAWIIPIDEMLGKLRYNNPIYSVRQEFGQLIIIHDELKAGQKEVIKEAEKKIAKLDIDLLKEAESTCKN